jgi:hypothetical protein
MTYDHVAYVVIDRPFMLFHAIYILVGRRTVDRRACIFSHMQFQSANL